jgi:hypothetical protein
VYLQRADTFDTKQFTFVLAGRFLIASMDSSVAAIIVSIVLGVEELVMRLTLRHRDHLVNRIIYGKERADELAVDEEETKVKAMIISTEMISEYIALFLTPALVIFMFDHRHIWDLQYSDTRPEWNEQLFIALTQILVEIVIDTFCVIVERIDNMPVKKQTENMLHGVPRLLFFTVIALHLFLNYFFTRPC